MSSLQAKLQHKYALSEKGAKDMIKAFVSVTCSDLVLMFPVWMLYFLVRDYLQGTMAGRGVFYIVGCVLCLLLIALTTLVQYRATFLATYVESGVRRIALAEQLRKIPLSFFGKKDLSDLTSTIMADCATMETASSHFIPELVGSCISTTLIAVGTFFMNWRMAIAALWVLPVSFFIVGCSGRVQKSLSKKQMKLKMDCADGIQECLETVRDLRANNAQAEYMEGLEGKIRAVEKHALVTELGTAVFVGGAQMILKLGIATVALTGGVLLVKGEIDILTFFVFLLLVSRMYDPLQVALQNLAAIISTSVQCDRLDEILSHEIQTGASTMDPKGYDIEFSHVGLTAEDYLRFVVQTQFPDAESVELKDVVGYDKLPSEQQKEIQKFGQVLLEAVKVGLSRSAMGSGFSQILNAYPDVAIAEYIIKLKNGKLLYHAAFAKFFIYDLCMPSGMMSTVDRRYWSVVDLKTATAPDEESLQVAMTEMNTMNASVKLNQQYQAAILAIQQGRNDRMKQEIFAGIARNQRQAAALSRQIQENAAEISDIQMSMYESTSAMQDRVTALRSEAIREVNPYVSSDGTVVDIPIGSGTQVWSTSDAGTILSSDSYFFNPNIGSTIEYQEMQLLR